VSSLRGWTRPITVLRQVEKVPLNLGGVFTLKLEVHSTQREQRLAQHANQPRKNTGADVDWMRENARTPNTMRYFDVTHDTTIRHSMTHALPSTVRGKKHAGNRKTENRGSKTRTKTKTCTCSSFILRHRNLVGNRSKTKRDTVSRPPHHTFQLGLINL
jgi:hypothetical protein